MHMGLERLTNGPGAPLHRGADPATRRLGASPRLQCSICGSVVRLAWGSAKASDMLLMKI